MGIRNLQLGQARREEGVTWDASDGPGLLDPPSLQQPILRRFAPPDNSSPSFPVPEQGSAPPAAASSRQPRVSRCLGRPSGLRRATAQGSPVLGAHGLARGKAGSSRPLPWDAAVAAQAPAGSAGTAPTGCDGGALPLRSVSRAGQGLVCGLCPRLRGLHGAGD